MTILGPLLSAERVVTRSRGDPKCAVPLVTTRVDSTLLTTGTRISDGAGGAVRAATSAGDLICAAATQVASDDTRTAPAMKRTRCLLRMFLATLLPVAVAILRHVHPSHCEPALLTAR